MIDFVHTDGRHSICATNRVPSSTLSSPPSTLYPFFSTQVSSKPRPLCDPHIAHATCQKLTPLCPPLTCARLYLNCACLSLKMSMPASHMYMPVSQLRMPGSQRGHACLPHAHACLSTAHACLSKRACLPPHIHMPASPHAHACLSPAHACPSKRACLPLNYASSHLHMLSLQHSCRL